MVMQFSTASTAAASPSLWPTAAGHQSDVLKMFTQQTAAAKDYAIEFLDDTSQQLFDCCVAPPEFRLPPPPDPMAFLQPDPDVIWESCPLQSPFAPACFYGGGGSSDTTQSLHSLNLNDWTMFLISAIVVFALVAVGAVLVIYCLKRKGFCGGNSSKSAASNTASTFGSARMFGDISPSCSSTADQSTRWAFASATLPPAGFIDPTEILKHSTTADRSTFATPKQFYPLVLGNTGIGNCLSSSQYCIRKPTDPLPPNLIAISQSFYNSAALQHPPTPTAAAASTSSARRVLMRAIPPPTLLPQPFNYVSYDSAAANGGRKELGTIYQEIPENAEEYPISSSNHRNNHLHQSACKSIDNVAQTDFASSCSDGERTSSCTVFSEGLDSPTSLDDHHHHNCCLHPPTSEAAQQQPRPSTSGCSGSKVCFNNNLLKKSTVTQSTQSEDSFLDLVMPAAAAASTADSTIPELHHRCSSCCSAHYNSCRCEYCLNDTSGGRESGYATETNNSSSLSTAGHFGTWDSPVASRHSKSAIVAAVSTELSTSPTVRHSLRAAATQQPSRKYDRASRRFQTLHNDLSPFHKANRREPQQHSKHSSHQKVCNRRRTKQQQLSAANDDSNIYATPYFVQANPLAVDRSPNLAYLNDGSAYV